MSEKEKLQLENECLLKYSKAQMIQKYIDELEENCTLSDLWCKSQEKIKEVREYIKFLKEHYEELRTSPVEDSYFINDMLRQMFIQSIENYLIGIEDILDKENKE